MKIIIFLLTMILINKFAFSNEVEIINLHETKSLDKIVLDKLNNIDNNNTDTIDNESLDQQEEDTSKKQNSTEVQIDTEEDSIYELNFWQNVNPADLEIYLKNTQNIKSEILKTEFSVFLENISLDYNDDKNRKIFYSIVKHFYNSGNISKAYKLINSRDVSGDNNFAFYKIIELNYLLSTFQLEEVCNLKNEV